MATVFIPTMLLKLTGGVKQVDFEVRNVGQLIDQLDELYPGMKNNLVEEGKIRSTLAVAVDGEVARMGLLERLKDNCEVHFVPAIGGGGNPPGPDSRGG